MCLLNSFIKAGEDCIPHYYLCHYLPLTAGKDPLSRSLVRFKQRLQPDLDTWIASAVEAIRTLAIVADTVILRSLRHDETRVRPEFPGALDLLGKSLAVAFGCRYLPSLLTKSRSTLPNKFLSRGERRAELRQVYRFTPIPDLLPPSTPFLLIDDILTTGTTMRALIRAVRLRSASGPIRVFTLTRAANTV
jgi:predicted amidophosphoribosyltransferase